MVQEWFTQVNAGMIIFFEFIFKKVFIKQSYCDSCLLIKGHTSYLFQIITSQETVQFLVKNIYINKTKQNKQQFYRHQQVEQQENST